jgi:hypothetical protein
MASIGDTLTRRKKRADGRDTIRLTAFNGSAWVAEPLDEFGSPFTVGAESLVTEYGSKAPDLPEDERDAMRKADAEANTRAAQAWGKIAARRAVDDGQLRPSDLRPLEGRYAPPPGSPEAVFASMEDGED